MTDTERQCRQECTALFEFAINAMEWMQRPTPKGKGWLVEAARGAAGLTGTPERFEEFADWLDQQPHEQSQAGGDER